MDISFYSYSGDNKIVDKSLTSITTVTDAHPFEPLSALTGQLILEYKQTVYDANYAKFNDRYYFVTDRELLIGGKMRLICKIDVLMTFDISNVPVVPARSESTFNDFVIDTAQPVETRVQHYNLLFSGDNLDYTNMTMIAGIVGTGGTPTEF